MPSRPQLTRLQRYNDGRPSRRGSGGACPRARARGRELSGDRASSILKELGDALEAALDGDLELDDIGCEYCVASQRHN